MRYPDRVVDVHTHIFNAHHLPIEGMLLTWLKARVPPRSRADRFKVWLAKRLKNLSIRLIEVAPAEERLLSSLARAGDEHEEEALIADVYARLLQAATQRVEAGPERGAREFELFQEDFEDRVAPDPLLRELAEIQMVFEASRERSDRPTTRTDIEVPTGDEVDAWMSELMAPASVLPARGLPAAVSVIQYSAIRWLLTKAARLLVDWAMDHAETFIEFYHRMVGLERENAARLLQSYRPDQNVHVIVHLMMDMENAFIDVDEDPFWPLDVQLERMRRVAEDLSGTVIGFAAFDPRREDWREVCDRALELGFWGFKFYPAMGYRPAGNAVRTIEARCREFFEYCVEREIPVFTHCTPTGFQAAKGSGLNADPDHWRALLEMPCMHELRLCLGHAGGGTQRNGPVKSPGWYATPRQWKDANNYAKKVVELCTAYPNVYCEVGHLHEVVRDAKVRARFVRNFSREWSAATQPYRFSDKCMYGSDAHMPMIVRSTQKFLAVFRGLFSSTFGADEFEKFCHGNAARYLQL